MFSDTISKCEHRGKEKEIFIETFLGPTFSYFYPCSIIIVPVVRLLVTFLVVQL